MNKAIDWAQRGITKCSEVWEKKSLTRDLQIIFNEKVIDIQDSSVEKWVDDDDFELWKETGEQVQALRKETVRIYNEDIGFTDSFLSDKLNKETEELVSLHNRKDISDDEKNSLRDILDFLYSIKLHGGLYDKMKIDFCFDCGVPIVGTDFESGFGNHCEECHPVTKSAGDIIVKEKGALNIGCNIDVEGDIIFKTGSTLVLSIDSSMDDYPSVKGKIIVEEGVTILDWGDYPDYSVPSPYFDLEDRKGPIDVDAIDWDPRSFDWYKLEGYLEARSHARINHDGDNFWHIGKTNRKVEIENWD